MPPRHAAQPDRRERRRQRLPRIELPADLPITAERDRIVAAIREHPVVVICGDTGSGKSTQLPKLCLEAGRGLDGWIGHTQPRRIAARTLAARIAEELSSPLGRDVGFKIRFTDTAPRDAFIKLMTDGILLAETRRDRRLMQYDTLILDEAHERSLNIDFLLGYLHRLMPQRPDLRLIITSATIDPQRFADHFAQRGRPAPIIEVGGRTYPVEVRYRPVADEQDSDTALDAVVAAVEELAREGPGDMLVFLPTERDILETARRLRGRRLAGDGPGQETEVLPLYARLSPAEQQRVFAPHQARRIVLATNVAETSLTVPGIRYVIDTGTARISRYSARARVQRLPIEPISQASADQRKGRCGRVGPGVCVRLYAQEDYEQRDAFTAPEILRTNLAQVVLQMEALGLGAVEDFPFVEPPKPATVREGRATLHELRAVDGQGRLTDVGRKLARLPVDPRLGRMILAGDAEHCVREVLVIAAALAAQEPRLRPPEQQQAADEAHAPFRHERSDFLSLLRLWDFYHGLMHKLSRNQLRKACRQNFLSYTRMREWVDVHRQLRELVEEAGLRTRSPKEPEPSEDAIHRALLSGLLSNIATLTDVNAYTGAGGKKLYLWPGSVLFAKKPKWIFAAELVETTQLYARTAAPLDPAWLEPLAPHLLRRSHAEPHWDRRSAHVQAFERVTLFGLTVVPRRRVNFARVDPVEARRLFIHHALVEQDYDTDAAFFRHNAELIERVERLESKLRRRDLLADQQRRYAFYDARVPEHVADGPTFERWRKEAERNEPRLLFMSESDVLAEPTDDAVERRFPDRVEVGGAELPLDYRLEPGAADDGVTLTTPLALVNQLDAERLSWLIPGRLEEKITAMIRSLPKALRRHFVPAPAAAAKAAEMIEFGRGRFEDAVAEALGRLAHEPIDPSLFSTDALEPHLRMNVRVVDDSGEVLAEGRELAELRAAVGAEAADAFATIGDDDLQRDGMTRWEVGELPATVTARRVGAAVTAYPALVDQNDAVGVRVFDTAERATREHQRGLRRLFAIQTGRELRHQVEHHGQWNALCLAHATLGDAAALRGQLVDRLAERVFLDDAADVRDPAAFAERLEGRWPRIAGVAEAVLAHAAQVLAAHQQARAALDTIANKPAFAAAAKDVRQQLDALVADRFLADTPWDWLAQYPRYFVAAAKRIEKLQRGGAARDAQLTAELQPLVQPYRQRLAEHERQGVIDPELALYGWMLQEYRVSLFAQELGTAMPVSAKRLAGQWRRVRP